MTLREIFHAKTQRRKGSAKNTKGFYDFTLRETQLINPLPAAPGIFPSNSGEHIPG
jgi:hypothetical protein